MENFVNHIQTLKDEIENEGIEKIDNPYFISLGNFEKSVEFRRKQVEEAMLDGNYDVARLHLAILGRKLSELYERTIVLEEEEKKNCNCIQNVTLENLNGYIRYVMKGLENGYREYYSGDSKTRRFFFKLTNWILWKLPYFQESKEFSKKSSVRLFFRNHIFYWLWKPFLRDKKPRNPFRSKIYDASSFEISSGWYGLIRALLEELHYAGWNKEICQVKEKFGGLRFYINGGSKEIFDIIHKYEEKSYEICEECGSAGKVRPGGWIRTLCDEHAKEKK
jgi:hypothetical protein